MSHGAAAVLCAAAALVGVGCGGEEGDQDGRAKELQEFRQERLAIIKAQIRRKELPPITVRLFDLSGAIDLQIVDGPKGDRDVIRTRANGTKGPPLKWDLDQDGRIDAEERRITERELYDAILPASEEARRRVNSTPDGRKS